MNRQTKLVVIMPCRPGTAVYVASKREEGVIVMYVHHFEVHLNTGVWAKLVDSMVATQRTSMVNVKAFGKQVFIDKSDAFAVLNGRR